MHVPANDPPCDQRAAVTPVRVECGRCGTHAIVSPDDAGPCPCCESYDLSAVAPAVRVERREPAHR